MLLLLVRHGLTSITGKRLTGWLPGYHLSDEGRAQAQQLAERMADVPLNSVYSSPLERCRETAQALTKGRGLRVRTLEDAGEIHYGDWQGRSLKSLMKTKAWSELNQKRADFRFPNGETPREAQARGVRAVESLRKEHNRKVVALVSHADMIRLIIAGYIGLTLEMYNRLTINPATVSVLSLGWRQPSLMALNHPGNLDWIAGYVRSRARQTNAAPRSRSAGASRTKR